MTTRRPALRTATLYEHRPGSAPKLRALAPQHLLDPLLTIAPCAAVGGTTMTPTR